MAVETENLSDVQVGDAFPVRALVQLGDMAIGDVAVEFCLGEVDPGGDIVGSEAVPMSAVEACGGGVYRFEARGITCRRSGLHGCTVRVLPHHPDLNTQLLPGLITWAYNAG